MDDYNDCYCDLCQQCKEMNDFDINTGQLILANNTGIPNITVETTQINSQVSIKHCSLCPGTTEYYCHDCKSDLCRPFKEMHVDMLDIKRHSTSIYSRKFNNDPRREVCPEHQGQVIDMYCVPCDLPVCFHCRKHRNHIVQYTSTVSENKRMQFNNTIINISCQSIYNAQVLLNKLKSDFTTCHKEMDQLKTIMVSMSKRLKDSMDNVQSDISLKYKDLLVCRLVRQRRTKMKRNIASIQKYEHRNEQSANRPVQFLKFIKTVHLPKIEDTPRLSQQCLLSLTQKINTGDIIKLLSEIKISESGKQRQAEIELLPTLMSSPVLLKTLTVLHTYCDHISCVRSDRVWVSDSWNSIILIDTATGNAIYRLKDTSGLDSGKHTVNNDSELIYINNHDTISKLSADMKTTTLLIDKTEPEWDPICVYCSPSSGDLLIGMSGYESGMVIGKVMRYNDSCQLIQTIPQNNTPDNLYWDPVYITENNNGDVVVSDEKHKAVVVTTRKGIHRFSYKGPPPLGSKLSPLGICTDTLSHILVCDSETSSVQMLSKDGAFLKYFLTFKLPREDYLLLDIPFASCLSYDTHTHSLLVGISFLRNGSMLSVYRHINRHPAILDTSDQ